LEDKLKNTKTKQEAEDCWPPLSKGLAVNLKIVTRKRQYKNTKIERQIQKYKNKNKRQKIAGLLFPKV